ncbi:hypothetical protein BJ912DRAFT_1042439 [Pholiota molesta]|nr:hypothetical protein BJ912DRAFT_1042439 [Pholiota molesta]
MAPTYYLSYQPPRRLRSLTSTTLGAHEYYSIDASVTQDTAAHSLPLDSNGDGGPHRPPAQAIANINTHSPLPYPPPHRFAHGSHTLWRTATATVRRAKATRRRHDEARTIYGNQSSVNNDTTTLGYGRLTGWLRRQRLVARGGRGREQRTAQLSENITSKTIAPPFVQRRAAGYLAVTTSQLQHTAARRHGNAGQQRVNGLRVEMGNLPGRTVGAQRTASAAFLRHANACAEGRRDGPRTTMRTPRYVKIRPSVPHLPTRTPITSEMAKARTAILAAAQYRTKAR